MLHLFLEKGAWFRAQSHGYGAGRPIAWQGWVMIAAHLALIVGLARLLHGRPVLMPLALLLAVLAPLPIYRARTDGGWHWRWGRRD